MDTTGWEEARKRIAAEQDAQTGFLDLGCLELRELPPELFELELLQGLNLGSWYVDDTGENHLSPTWWTMAANHFTSLPHILSRLNQLRRLFLVGVPITDLAPLAALPHLTSLLCSGSAITDLSPLAGLNRLEILRCSNTAITDLTPLMGLKALVALDIARTRVDGLAPLADMIQLQSLECGQTSVHDLAPLARLVNLTALNCSDLAIIDLTPLKNLKALDSLDLSGTNVTDISHLACLISISSLTCAKSGITELEPLILLRSLVTLDCSHTGVKNLLPLGGLSSLQRLNCASTPITDLSPLACLTSLQALFCSDTAIRDLTPLSSLASLRTLDCSGTLVADLTPLVGQSGLTVLKCNNTLVSELRHAADLSALSVLDISNTRVTDLSPLTELKSVHSVNISNTQVTNLEALPRLAKHPYLPGILRASRCTLDDLPIQVLQDPNLQRLYLYESRIPGVPPEVLSHKPYEDCLESVRAHFDDLSTGATPLRNSKIIVLGNGRIGKTQLCRRLRGLDFDPTISSTHGITITSAAFDEEETLNLWDFGGQDIYHGVHALFMRTRSVFVIAWQPDLESTATHTHEGITFRNHPLVYWLEFVRAMGAPGSPIILVQCQCEQRRDEVRTLPVDPAVLAELNVIPVAYSARTDRGRAALNEAIGEAIAELRKRDGLASIGAGRARVVEQLESWRREDEQRVPPERLHRTLAREQFTVLCSEVGGVSSPAALLHYLHHSGLIFHDPARFSDRILLDQSWALDAVYTVFDRHRAWRHLQATNGRFTRQLLEATVWADYAAVDQRLFLSLMLSCGICFRHRGRPASEIGDDDEFIAPDLLPDDRAIAEHMEGRWDETAATRRLIYTYEFLHPGLFRGLMSDIGQTAENAGVYWRTGLWLYEPKSRTRARIDVTMETERRGSITLSLQGQNLALVQWLRERFARQHRLFGQTFLAPTLDELPVMDLPASEEEAPLHSAPERKEPAFAPLPPTDFVRAEPTRPRVFISYAWRDGRQHADGLRDALLARGADVHMDRLDTRVGDRLSAFMDRLVAGDFVFIVVSEAYLRSEFCMYELFNIWQRVQRDEHRFLARVIPIVQPCANIETFPKRTAHARHWNECFNEYDELVKQDPDIVGTKDFANYKKVSEYRLHTADMLYLLNDRLTPRDLAALAATNYAEVISLVDP